MTYDVGSLLVETAERLLAGASTYDAVEAAETEGWCVPLWDQLAEAGFPWISVSEAAGGTGGTLADAMAVLRCAGRHAAPVPLAETGVLGGWLAEAAGFSIADGPVSVVPDATALGLADGRVQGEAVVAWGRQASRIHALVAGDGGWLIVAADPAQLQITAGTNLAGEPRDTIRFDVPLDEVDHAEAPAGIDGDALRRRGALTRVVLAAGALEAMGQLTIDYAHDRRQFGRPIAAFEAVRHLLVTTAQASVRVSMAADCAVRAMSRGDAVFEVAAARVVTDAAAAEATRAAHQAHGAMGMTREYRLHQFSRRLWAWPHEYGSTRSWRRALGAMVAVGGGDSLFATVTR
jgi:acyl-CoA dehydrogenase